MKLIDHAQNFTGNTAILSDGKSYSYNNLLKASAQIATLLLKGEDDLEETRVAFIMYPGFDYVAVQWGIWRAGGIAVPLNIQSPPAEIEYTLNNAGCKILIAETGFLRSLMTIPAIEEIDLIPATKILASDSKEKLLPDLTPDRTAMLLYTSGTTSRPKGVMITHANIEAQTSCLINAWEWTDRDRILSVLPLHHVHGIVNVVTTALRSGATIDFLPKFDAQEVWNRFIKTDLTLFMAVPTIYFKLIEHWEQCCATSQQLMSEACSKIRLMVSGSAALPVSLLEKWRAISGHTLLERYGMTEIGMALSNPLHGERKAGFVGTPLPGVEIKLADEGYNHAMPGEAGEILVKSKNVFKGYWKEQELTENSFRDGWFCTGDMAIQSDGYYKIIGRASVDIIKSGGYKISALEIEETLRQHPDIVDCAVVGVPDEQWGETVALAAVINDQKSVSLPFISTWLKDKLAGYKIPKNLIVVDDLPRNALGKVMKPEVKKLFE